MATRGYFTIINGEGTTDIQEVYQKTGNIFVEAYHDGYLAEMIRDILTIPFHLAKMQHQGYGKQFITMYFFPETFYPAEWLEKFPERGAKEFDFEEILRTNISLGFYDIFWSDLLSLLQFTCFGKYMDIQEGVIRYGHPVTMVDSDFVTISTTESRLDWLKINQINLDEDDDDFIPEMIADLNQYIIPDKFKITYENGLITMSITGIALALMHNAAKTGIIIDPNHIGRGGI